MSSIIIIFALKDWRRNNRYWCIDIQILNIKGKKSERQIDKYRHKKENRHRYKIDIEKKTEIQKEIKRQTQRDRKRQREKKDIYFKKDTEKKIISIRQKDRIRQ